MTGPFFEHLLGADDVDPGCDAGFEIIDQYVDAVLRGDDVALKYSGMLVHLRHCPACREDIDGLLAAARQVTPPPEQG
jgi:hypothetical protein